MADSSRETQNQIVQMSQFILNEAKDRAEEITSKALQEFSIEKLKFVNQTKAKIRQDYLRKTKQVETQNAIARSSAINRSRLEKIRARNDKLTQLATAARSVITTELKSEAKIKSFYTDLIVQGLLMFLEDEVQVRCRKCDEAIVQSCLADAAAKYSKIVKAEGQTDKQCKVTIDKSVSLPPAPTAGQEFGTSCLGGVALACQNGTITIDNTIDSRLGLVLEQAKPTIRRLLFTPA